MNHWSQYDWAIPMAEAEALQLPDRQKDYKQYLPSDPTHPRAYIPPHVRWAKRKQVEFICPITGWKETDWYRPIGGGPTKLIGPLTMDHIIPGALGGLTTDENIRAISLLANAKKGRKIVSDEELRNRIHSAYMKVDLPEDLRLMLVQYNITLFKVGLTK